MVCCSKEALATLAAVLLMTSSCLGAIALLSFGIIISANIKMANGWGFKDTFKKIRKKPAELSKSLPNPTFIKTLLTSGETATSIIEPGVWIFLIIISIKAGICILLYSGVNNRNIKYMKIWMIHLIIEELIIWTPFKIIFLVYDEERSNHLILHISIFLGSYALFAIVLRLIYAYMIQIQMRIKNAKINRENNALFSTRASDKDKSNNNNNNNNKENEEDKSIESGINKILVSTIGNIDFGPENENKKPNMTVVSEEKPKEA